MKTVVTTLILLFLLCSQAKAQNINLIPNPDTSLGFFQNFQIFQGKVVGLYLNNKTNTIQFGVLENNDSVKLIPNPDSGSFLYCFGLSNNTYIDSVENRYSFYSSPSRPYNFNAGKIPEINSCLYFGYKSQSGDTVLAKFDGSNVSLIPILPQIPFPVYLNFLSLPQNYTQYNNCIYFSVYTKNSGVYNLIKFDGTNFSVIKNPAGIIYDFNPNLVLCFSFNNNLYGFYNTITRPSNSFDSYICKIVYDSAIICSQKITAPFAIYEKETIGNNIYLDYMCTTLGYGNRLIRFNGNNANEILFGSQKTYPYQDLSKTSRMVNYNGNLYFSAHDTNSIGITTQEKVLFKYDGNNLTKENLFPVKPYISPELKVFDDKLYATIDLHPDTTKPFPKNDIISVDDKLNPITYYATDTNYYADNIVIFKNQVLVNQGMRRFFYSDKHDYFTTMYNIGYINTDINKIVNIQNPDSGWGGWITDTLNNRAYLVYRNAQRKYQLGYIEMPAKTLAFRFSTFSANAVSTSKVKLDWTAKNETKNASYYKVNRSDNGGTYKSISSTNATGNCCYSFTDDSLPNFDASGNLNLNYLIEAYNSENAVVKTSEIKNTQLQNFIDTTPVVNNKFVFKIYPNPVSDVLQIDCINVKQVEIVDELGRVIKIIEKPNQKSTLNVRRFGKAVYFLRATFENNTIQIEKVIVQ